MSDNHLMSVWAYDKAGQKVYPYKGARGAKQGQYNVNFTNDTTKFQGLDEEALLLAIKDGRFRDRGTIRMCRANVATGSNAFAPVVYDGARIKGF